MILAPRRSRSTISSDFICSVTNEFEIGQVVKPIPRSIARSTNAGSSTMFVP